MGGGGSFKVESGGVGQRSNPLTQRTTELGLSREEIAREKSVKRKAPFSSPFQVFRRSGPTGSPEEVSYASHDSPRSYDVKISPGSDQF